MKEKKKFFLCNLTKKKKEINFISYKKNEKLKFVTQI